jgi:hypothetical protein
MTKTYESALRTSELEKMTTKEKLEYLTSFPCSLFLNEQLRVDILECLEDWKENEKVRIKLDKTEKFAREGLDQLKKVKSATWKTKFNNP